MADNELAAPPATAAPRPTAFGTFCNELDVVKLIAIAVVGAWIASIFLKVPMDETLKNVVMVLFGYYYGSSTGSKKKDDAILPPPH